MSPFRTVIASKVETAKAKAEAVAKLAADQAAVVADQAAVTSATTADQAADAAISTAITDASDTVGFVVDPVVNADGTFTVYARDNSPAGYHAFAAPSADATHAPHVPPAG